MKSLCILLMKILEYKHIPKLWLKLNKTKQKNATTTTKLHLEITGDFIFLCDPFVQDRGILYWNRNTSGEILIKLSGFILILRQCTWRREREWKHLN